VVIIEGGFVRGTLSVRFVCSLALVWIFFTHAFFSFSSYLVLRSFLLCGVFYD